MLKKMKVIFLLTVTILLSNVLPAAKSAPSKMHPLSDEFINHINSLNSTWMAGRNFEKDISMHYIRKLMGVLKNQPKIFPERTYDLKYVTIPKEFDSRKHWPSCPSIKEIRDQGGCGSCWAISSVEVMTDRYCIFSKNKKQFHFSVQDVLACTTQAYGCSGGWPIIALNYWIEEGIVSGGSYNSSQGCIPYGISPCEHHVHGPRDPCGAERTPVCIQKCEPSYDVDYKKDLHYGSDAYGLNSDEKQIQAEIMANGPIVASFDVFEDFLHYKTGVYQATSGSYLGGHAVKIIGWGVEEATNTPYWLIANSWNYDWGENGFFRILRGKNECRIESDLCGATPIIS